jgi:prevent-host-death family protein
MVTVTALEARARLGELLDRVANGEEVVITRYAKPVVRMIPAGPQNAATVSRAVVDLVQLRERIRARGKGRPRLSARVVRTAIEESRL